MSNDMEQIEARLAGYIDGTLPPDQRAEIEAYLAANPTHARLITELQSIKAAVGNLPRDKAPAEVMDTIQSQLERHVLLDGVEEGAGPPRINRWPQLGAVAAMLLLMAGLGLLVYQVLPRHKDADAGLALLPSSTRAIVPDSELPDGAPVTLDAGPVVSSTSAMRKDEQLKTFASPSTKPGEANMPVAADHAATQSVVAPLSDLAMVVPQGPMPTALPSANSEDRFQIRGAITQPYNTEWGPPPATQADDFGYVVIETVDPVMTRNLMAASLATAGHRTEAGEIKSPTTTATVPATMYSDGSVDWTASVWPGASGSAYKQHKPTADRFTVGDAYLIVRDLQPADIERLRSAASGAHGVLVVDPSATQHAATTGPIKSWMLVFHPLPTTPAAVTAGIAPVSTAPAVVSPSASSQIPATSPAPSAPELP